MEANQNPPSRILTRQRLEIIRQNLDKADVAIAQILGISRAAVNELRRRYKIAKVRADTQRKKRFLRRMRRLRPGLSTNAAALKLGVSQDGARYYGKIIGYQFTRISVQRYSHRKKQLANLPPGMTLREVKQRLNVSYGYALELCQRHRYKVHYTGSSKPPRVPVRPWLRGMKTKKGI